MAARWSVEYAPRAARWYRARLTRGRKHKVQIRVWRRLGGGPWMAEVVEPFYVRLGAEVDDKGRPMLTPDMRIGIDEAIALAIKAADKWWREHRRAASLLLGDGSND